MRLSKRSTVSKRVWSNFSNFWEFLKTNIITWSDMQPGRRTTRGTILRMPSVAYFLNILRFVNVEVDLSYRKSASRPTILKFDGKRNGSQIFGIFIDFSEFFNFFCCISGVEYVSVLCSQVCGERIFYWRWGERISP